MRRGIFALQNSSGIYDVKVKILRETPKRYYQCIVLETNDPYHEFKPGDSVRVPKDALTRLEEISECLDCGTLMEYKECENYNGLGWTDANIPDNDCTVCNQRGGAWVCPKCGASYG